MRATAIHSREEEGPYDSDHDGSMSSFVSFSADGNEFIDGSTKNLKIPKSHTEHTGQHETAGKCAVIGGGSGHDDSKQSESQRSSPKLDAPEVRYNDVGVLRQVPFPSWVEQFVRQLLGAKTSFSFFLVQSFKSCRSGRDDFTATALFPIPWPFLEITETGPARPSQRSRLLKAQKKLVHCAVMAMNYEYFRAPFAVLPLLRRQPSALHLQVYHRLMAFVRACGPSCNVSIAGCGRKSFQLDARFNELLKGLEGLGLEAKSKYHSGFEAEEVPLDDSRYEELKPYRELDAGRIKIAGKGQWRCEEFLSDFLYMPFVEPRVLRWNGKPPCGSYPNVEQCDPEEVLKLCLIWDANNLLTLIPKCYGPADDQKFLHTRIFGNYKRIDADRQIGDRRGANYVEGILRGGPSSNLPTGPSLLQLEVPRFSKVLCGSVTDRRDFYHQFAVPFERASTNTLFPAFNAARFVGTRAHEEYAFHFSPQSKKKAREDVGDFLGEPQPLLVEGSSEGEVYACFQSLLQGDHLGVEFACDSHGRLLEEQGCRDPLSILQSDEAVIHNDPATGLVIDDFFIVSVEDRILASGDRLLKQGKSSQVLDKAKDVYASEGITGSDDKEVRDALVFRAVGAEINSSTVLVDRGLVSIGAPLDKRLGLAMISAALANLPYTSDALHATLMGSWISALMFRRCLMAHVNDLFQVIAPEELDTLRPRLRRLPRKAAEELLILATLAPFAASNIAAPFADRIYASDASTGKGGFVRAPVPQEIAKILWRTADRKGKNVALPSKTAALHSYHDESFEFFDEPLPAGDGESAEEVERPIGLYFEFIEVFGGAGVVTKHLVALGVVCGPILDLSESLQYDLRKCRVFSWLCFMMENHRLRSFLAAPPGTTFSPAAHPALRSYLMPLGFDRLHPRVLHGNQLAFASLGLMTVALRMDVYGMTETTRRSKLRWTPMWRRLLARGAQEVILASCAFGSPHQKEFAFMNVHMDVDHLHRKCPRNHVHIRVEGCYTKASATYTEGLAIELAKAFRDHLRPLNAHCDIEEKKGLEDIMSNDLSTSLEWETVSAWRWKGVSHINLLEVASGLRVFEEEAKQGGDVRFVNLYDSHVALCSINRGRTSSLALRPLLKRASSLSIAYGLYHAGRFTPTRLNPADHPTRDSDIPAPTRSLAPHLPQEVRWLCTLKGLRRWTSNWIRLSILLVPSWISFFADPSASRRYPPTIGLRSRSSMDFDQTLGFPGEGPQWLRAFWGIPFWILLTGWTPVAVAVPSHGDLQRQKSRAGIELPEGRRVTEQTSSFRAQLLVNLGSWLRTVGTSFDDLIWENPPNLDKINSFLANYGRYLFDQGKPYSHYSETLNAVSTKRPVLRRSLSQAWDLAFMWCSFEPVEHHQSMPFQLLLALLSTCLLWGWRREAGVFALAWGGLFRIGEILSATRADLVFPHDVMHSIDHILLKVREPKTRFRAARHQSGKVEAPDLIETCWLGLGDLRKDEKLWPGSSSTLRSRLDKVMSRLGLPTTTKSKVKPMTLSSFRPGGATHLIALTESAETVRRRGRWASMKVMEVYLQEVSTSTYLNDIEEESKQKVLQAMSVFPEVLKLANAFSQWQYPEPTWNWFFQHGHKARHSTQWG